MTDGEKQYLHAIANRCSISRDCDCFNCKAVEMAVKYVNQLQLVKEFTEKDDAVS